jgi:hypothetical protein
MGAAIDVYIEYDRSRDYGAGAEPFSTEVDHIGLDFVDLRSGKDYPFMGALTGARNRSDKLPLYPLRGYPPGVDPHVFKELDELYDADQVGWLRPSEIDAALAHQGWDRSELSWQVNLLLRMLDYLAETLGDEYVRLVFATQ